LKILQINTAVNTGSTGRIAEDIGRTLLAHGHKSVIAAGKTDRPSQSEVISIGTKQDMWLHALKTRLTDRHGFGSANATEELSQRLRALKPDLIHLHNVHGYYLNIKVLFKTIQTTNIPIVWTLHDSWPYTGHCTYYQSVNCRKWQSECFDCPKTDKYPKSYFVDNSKRNFRDKKTLYGDLKRLHFVTPSVWLGDDLGKSFLGHQPRSVIHNGVDLTVFKPGNGTLKKNDDKNFILGVASTWDLRKGLRDFEKLSKKITQDWQIVLIGLSKKQIDGLPGGEAIKGIRRTENIEELRRWYARARVFVNPTWQDNFPTTNIEALACGTPVVTYNTGGSPEAVNEGTGVLVEKGDIEGLWQAVQEIDAGDREIQQKRCRHRAETYFNKDDRYMDYLRLYEELVK